MQRNDDRVEAGTPGWPEGAAAGTADLPASHGAASLPGIYLRRDPSPSVPRVPLIVDSPHSGRRYPDDFGHALPLETLRRAEDAWVDELVQDAPDRGAALLTAEFPRAYVDPNRHEHDLDGDLIDEPLPPHAKPTYRSEWGLGVVRRLLGPREAIYQRRLTVAEIHRRIDLYHRPYHEALAAMIEEAHRIFRCAYHLNVHSMLSKSRGRPRADFVLSDCDGETCDRAYIDMVRAHLEKEGYAVAINDPFKGGEIVRRYGNPSTARHSLQIEIRRGLYMDERAILKSEGFEAVRATMSDLIAAIANFSRERAG